MTYQYDSGNNVWTNIVQAVDDNMLMLPPEVDNVECWHLTDLGSALTGLVNGLSLTSFAATSIGQFGEAVGYHANGGCYLECADTSLRLAGDMTLEMIMHRHEKQGETPNGAYSVLACWQGGSGETAPTNTLYQLAVDNFYDMSWLSESGAGVNATYTSAYGLSVGQFHYVVAVRESNVVKFYVNGVLRGTSPTLATPTGGDAASGRFVLSANLDGFRSHMTIFSCAVTASARSEAHIVSRYNETMGLFYGPSN